MNASQVWLVTGANRGLGRAITLAALDAGHSVVATVRGDHSLEAHDRLDVYRLDVRERDDAHRVVAHAVETFGALDVLVNNAGYGLIGAIEEITEADAREILDTDLLGALWLSQAAVTVMRERGSGRIVQISTVGAVGTMPTLGLYNAAKWGLEGFSEALANEVRDLGIRVIIAELGEIDTEWGTGSMRYSTPHPAYDELRAAIFGSPELPESSGTGGGTPPEVAAADILRVVADDSDERLRVLIGDDAPAQVAAALALRTADYERDARFTAAQDDAS